MSVKITPFPTISGQERALDYTSTGIKIDVQYIGVGKGSQQIDLDDAGNAIQDTLADLVAWLPIKSSKRVGKYQHQFTIDISGLTDTEWNFTELVLGDTEKNGISIAGNASGGWMTVSPAVDAHLIVVNMVLGSFAADSINIIHQGAPIELLTVGDVLALHNAIGTMALARMRAHLANEKDKRERLAAEAVQQKIIDAQQVEISYLGGELKQLKALLSDLTSSHHKQVITTHNAVGTLANTQMKRTIGALN